MGENTVALKNCIKDRTPTYTKIFPIKTLEILKSLEENINETNEKEYVRKSLFLCCQYLI